MKNRKFKEIFLNAIYFCLGAWMFFFSTYYPVSIGNSASSFLLTFPTPVICLIFAVLHTIIEMNIDVKKYYEALQFNGTFYIFRCVSLLMIYFALYSIVILPFSMVALIEWILILLIQIVFLMPAVNMKKFKSTHQLVVIEKRTWVLLVMLALLFLAKMAFFYLFDDDLYSDSINGNKTMRTIIALIPFAAVWFCTKRKKLQFPKKPEEEKKAATNFFQKAGRFCKKTWKSITTLFTAVFTPKVILIIIVVAIALTAIFAGSVFALLLNKIKKIIDDINRFVEPVFNKMLSTGEKRFSPDNRYKLYQLATVSLYIVYYLISKFAYIKDCKTLSEEDIVKIINEYSPLSDKGMQTGISEIEYQKLVNFIQLNKNNFKSISVKNPKFFETVVENEVQYLLEEKTETAEIPEA